MNKDGLKPRIVKIDGGMVANNWFSQFLADVINLKVIRPKVLETTALGAALFAGCLLYTSPSPRDATLSRMPSSA